MALVVGVDGCRGGWLAVSKNSSSGLIKAGIFPSPTAVLEAFPAAKIIAVDVPIGLTDSGQRVCDCDARHLLGAPRASSVFPAPIRPALNADTRLQASTINHKIDGRKVGCQSWSIYPYIRAWDDLLQKKTSARTRVFEVHPEVSFFAMNHNIALNFRKRSSEGRNQRHRLLTRHFSTREINKALDELQGLNFGKDDFYDALAALWSACRIAKENAISLPEHPTYDSTGLRMAIWY